MKYEESVKHKLLEPSHIKAILTSKEFASEERYISVARAMGKSKIIGDVEYFENPYKPRQKKGKVASSKTIDQTYLNTNLETAAELPVLKNFDKEVVRQ
mmetsp:Transcript_41439/g.30456  ORF Transcript_41439/g.30456 Transcript_41439/m.30456 type:complete len:99 (+) Transcript_41439:135-431(+)|eukprot:CAMPEP_0202966862 /NCGR_PEP_ID=MMETSP1396-20130829/11480_1 /ASSEMBLY_ACC=CAM_ASM_000872 /TAXON_ID= /ORGANISM="Pseudokeronopsis sp., Strain Brazil" /LENGTH=98 /DNA_ID=CAMNT_0049691223 /DNA_START=119 /DNA_END=418 /DNA_ORIENTATION=+